MKLPCSRNPRNSKQLLIVCWRLEIFREVHRTWLDSVDWTRGEKRCVSLAREFSSKVVLEVESEISFLYRVVCSECDSQNSRRRRSHWNIRDVDGQGLATIDNVFSNNHKDIRKYEIVEIFREFNNNLGFFWEVDLHEDGTISTETWEHCPDSPTLNPASHSEHFSPNGHIGCSFKLYTMYKYYYHFSSPEGGMGHIHFRFSQILHSCKPSRSQ